MAKVELEMLNEQLQSWLSIPGAVVEIETKVTIFQVRRISGWVTVVKPTQQYDNHRDQYKPVDGPEVAGTDVSFIQKPGQSETHFRLSKGDEEVFTLSNNPVRKVRLHINLS